VKLLLRSCATARASKGYSSFLFLFLFSLALRCGLAFASELLLLRKSTSTEKKLYSYFLLPEGALLLLRKSWLTPAKAIEQRLYSYFFVFLLFVLLR
jgi:hypothetical protein